MKVIFLLGPERINNLNSYHWINFWRTTTARQKTATGCKSHVDCNILTASHTSMIKKDFERLSRDCKKNNKLQEKYGKQQETLLACC